MKTLHIPKTKYRQIKLWLGVFCVFCFLPFLINAQKAQVPHQEEISAMGNKPQNLTQPPADEKTPPSPAVEKDSSAPAPADKKVPQAEKNPPAVEKELPAPAVEKESQTPPSAVDKNPLPSEKIPVTSPAVEKESSPAPVEQDSSSPLKKDSLPPTLPDQSDKKKLGYHHYSYASSFGGSGMGRGSFDRPAAIAVDSEDNIYVVDQGNNLIQKFTQNGDFICEWGRRGTQLGEFDSPSAIAIDKRDTVYVYIVDTNNNRIQRFNPNDPSFKEIRYSPNDPKYPTLFTAFGSLGSGKGKFQKPTDIAIDDDHTIYVVDSGNSRIQELKFDRDGNLEWKDRDGNPEWKEFGSYGSCRECFLAPSKIAYDPTGFGYLYVLDQNRKDFLLQKIDTSGRFLRTLDVFHSKDNPISKPSDIYFDADGFLYVVDQEKGSVGKFNADGEFIQKIGDPSSRETSLSKPQSIVQDSDKRLLILDSGSNRIKIFDQM